MATRHIVSAALESKGRAIAPELRARLEDCFGANLGDILVHVSEESDSANLALGSIAFTVGRHVCFSRRALSLLPQNFTAILAHELAHIVQRRPGVRSQMVGSPDVRALEAEAGQASALVLTGQPVRDLTYDPIDAPRCYGPAGHYYTAFYTALAVGLSPDAASKIAFYTQLPDLVCELDAIESGKFWGFWATAVYFEPVPKLCSHVLPEEYQKFWAASTEISIDKMIHHWQMQAGLHALTGGDALQETEHRRKILRRYKPAANDFLPFGLAVHAFGDSFAHRDFHDGKNMYGPPAGHAADIINAPLWFEGYSSGHDPDNIALRKPLFVNYGQELYSELARFSTVKPSVSLDDYLSNLKEVASRDDDEQQSLMLKDKITRLRGAGGSKDFYDPPDDTVPWDDFLKDGRHMSLNYAQLAEAYQYAGDWCGAAEPFKFSVHADFGVRASRSIDALENDAAIMLGLNLSPEEWMRQMGGF